MGELSKSMTSNCSEMLILSTHWKTRYSMVSEQTCTIDQKMDQSLWQTFNSFDLLHSSHMWTQPVLSCGKHCKIMQTETFSRLRFCRRSWGFKSTSGGTLCSFGSHTFVTISSMCKQQSSVSHSSTESKLISLDTRLWLDGFPVLDLWDLIVAVLHGNTNQSEQVQGDLFRTNLQRKRKFKERLMICTMLISFPQTCTLLERKLCCMCLKTTKQWSRWSSIQEVRQWDMSPESTELLSIGYLIESIWTPKSKSNTLTPKTNSQTYWSREISHVMCGGVLFARSPAPQRKCAWL